MVYILYIGRSCVYKYVFCIYIIYIIRIHYLLTPKFLLYYCGISTIILQEFRGGCTLSQGEGHNTWGNAPKKSNYTTCAHFIKSTRYTSKPNIFLIFGNFWGVKTVNFHGF